MKLIKARKQHRCHWCAWDILKGEQYAGWDSFNREDPEDFPFVRVKMHQECHADYLHTGGGDFYFYEATRPCIWEILDLKDKYLILNFNFLRYARLSEYYAKDCLVVCQEVEAYRIFMDDVLDIIKGFEHDKQRCCVLWKKF